ncbi:MAG: ParA family protein [Lachnospiraceae bacterium]|nr:ParA family protein [Lachnospiraceae bacterium]MBQ9594040.1 ParA family protein [Lachnospiraceae bacterium]
MSRILAIANQKGGVGKTTTAINLSAALAEAGQRVLAVDADPQGNMTSGFGLDKNEYENNTYTLMLGDSTIRESIVKEVLPRLDVLPSSVDLAATEIELVGIDKKEYILQKALRKIQKDYDFILIDCPPSLNTLTINALTAADRVIVPIQCEYYALEGLSQLIYTIDLIRQRLNPKLEIEGVVFTMYDARTNLSMQVVENVKENLDQKIFRSIIPRNVRLAEAPSFGMPITEYDSRCQGAQAYRNLADELLNDLQ